MATRPVGKAHRQNARHESFLRHGNYRYLKLASLMSLAAIVGYFMVDAQPRPNGGSLIGYTLGVIAALLIMWLTLLGVRKRAISQGNWKLKGWTSAHVYLGLSLIIIATLHTGFQFGWNVHTLAYALMMAVIISGLFGIYYYVTIPEEMSQNRAESSQADMLGELADIDRQLEEVAQPLSQPFVGWIQSAVTKTKITGGLMTRLSGQVKRDATARALAKIREAIPTAPSPLDEQLEDVASLLERKSVMLERARLHIRYKTLLELWLYFHVPLTFALLAALSAHIISVFFYW